MTDIEKFHNTIADLESGKVRVAEKIDGEWKVNSWVKEVILSGFRFGKLTDMTQGQLESTMEHLTGAAIQFSDTLKLEGLADGLTY